MRLSDFDYKLPEELIAQQPAAQREDSRLLVLNRMTGALSDRNFSDISTYLRRGDVLVVNNTQVMPARLLGRKSSGGRVELLLVRQDEKDPSLWLAMTRASKPMRVGTLIDFGPSLQAEILDAGEDYLRRVKLSWEGDLQDVLAEVGSIPLPPYISRDVVGDDYDRYQTVFASRLGSVAAPTAGLHFTEQILDKLKQDGVIVKELTLHVGPGTFLPVRTEDLSQHRMHSEVYSISDDLADTVNSARAEGRRVIAVGTTTTRALESASTLDGRLRAETSETDMFITPGYPFKVIDALVTNFHLPCSTLLMLVSAFAGYDMTMSAYRHAVAERYRFFSYGDCMLIL